MANTDRRDLRERAFELAKRVFLLFPQLARAGPAHAYVARQLMSATASIGANLEEGAAASSRRDMAHKYSIALRESRESRYWARLGATDVKWTGTLTPIAQESHEFVAMLTAAVKKLRRPAASATPLCAKRLDRTRRSKPDYRRRA